MTPEKNDKKIVRWLLAATIALLLLVLCLQLWQMFRPASAGQEAAARSASLSPGKRAMIEELQDLNSSLSFDDLTALSAEELEQLWETGAPGLPIGSSAAAMAAEEYAGTLEIDSVTSETDPELDETPAHYEVELHHPTMGEFKYKIGAYTGEVLEGLPDIMRSFQSGDAPASALPSGAQPSNAGMQTPGPETPAPGGQKQDSDQPAAVSDEEAAKNAAFAHAGIRAADASGVRCKLERDDGRQVYDIEFWVGSTEYDYKVDAVTYAVIEAKQERNDHLSGTAPQQPDDFIGSEAAKNAALAHAKISASDTGYIQCELDEDDGRWVYEIEFWSGGVEYEYEVDASAGTVVKAEQDR